MKILGIESSCDETAAAVLEFDALGQCNILSNAIFTQMDTHALYGGVVPEIASRMHLEKIDAIIKQAIEMAQLNLSDIDKIAVTSGPGLLGGLIVGTTYAKALSMAKNIDIIGINHLEGHALMAHLTEGLNFPYTLLLASGGHCQFLKIYEKENIDVHSSKKENMSEIGFKELGGTQDDAIGECFDKVAKMLNLPYPGGREIEALAKKGDPFAYSFPIPLKDGSVQFSFSGLKSAVRRVIDDIAEEMDSKKMADICASFQETIAQLLIYKCKKALEITQHKRLVLSGGVAANKLLRSRLKTFCDDLNVTFYAPPVNLCTDNAVMIAYAGGLRCLRSNHKAETITIKPRWSLNEVNEIL